MSSLRRLLRAATTGVAIPLVAVVSARIAAAAACPDLLAQERPAWSARVADSEVLTDGQGGAAARFDAPFGTAVWDLGMPRPVRSLSLLTRGEGAFEVAASDDGIAWRPLWRAQG